MLSLISVSLMFTLHDYLTMRTVVSRMDEATGMNFIYFYRALREDDVQILSKYK